ncbi:hypothetical protein EK21DRAFT_92681 [Setomelanomma holmii]|uniref:Uncharacterized protein n=1 Tax=Setomelanomma holmii TaxID=210430 RepID=A0A9P4H208_9PLEO|nr:hypothetical protein EK21DRAFT_92681 [Setomelanomma holmii]
MSLSWLDGIVRTTPPSLGTVCSACFLVGVCSHGCSTNSSLHFLSLLATSYVVIGYLIWRWATQEGTDISICCYLACGALVAISVVGWLAARTLERKFASWATRVCAAYAASKAFRRTKVPRPSLLTAFAVGAIDDGRKQTEWVAEETGDLIPVEVLSWKDVND